MSGGCGDCEDNEIYMKNMDDKIKDLEKKLAAYQGNGTSLSQILNALDDANKKLAEANDKVEKYKHNYICRRNAAASANTRLALAVDALEKLKETSCNCGKCASNDEPYFCIQCTALKQLSEQ